MVVGGWLRLTAFLTFCLFIWAVYVLLGMYVPANYALIGSLLCLFSIHTFFLSDLCFPETLFGLATVLFVIVHERTRGRLRLGLTSALAVAAYALRTVGVTLFAAWAAESFCKRR